MNLLSRLCVLWGSEATFTNNESELKTRGPEHGRMQKKRTQNSFSTVNFSKTGPLYKCRSASFYRETNRLFTHWDCPRVKRIDTECARLILGCLQLGLHVIGTSWRHAANHDAFPGVNTCVCRVKTLNSLETPPSPSTSLHLKHILKLEDERIRS
jgi:hypothetical protein